MDEFIRPSRRPKIELDSGPSENFDVAVMHINAPLAVAMEQSNEYDNPEPEQRPNSDGSSAKKPRGKKRFTWKVPTPKTKKQWAIAIAVMVLLLGGAGAAVYWFIIRDTTEPVVNQEPVEEPEAPPEPIYSIVSGRELKDKAINDRPIYAVQIENSPEARPQSGLRDADIVSEAVAEGGITRFNAIYHDNIPANIGPVRSLRPYYIDWFLPYDAAIVHAGGSAEALKDVGSLGLKDVDSNPQIMRRISSRYSPHNYYTRGQQVLDLLTQRGYKPNVASSLPRKYPPKEGEETETPETTETASAAPSAKVINVKISSALYNVRYTWDAENGIYLRDQGGAKHVDAENGKQIAPNVVIVPIMGKRLHRDGVHTQYTTTGSGKVYVFQDGTVTEGTWTKSLRAAQWVLKDADGKEIKLNPGQTWFTVTDVAGNVSITP
jgi:hypothetical protein